MRSLVYTLFCLAGLALAAPAQSAGYLKYGDIKGEATDDKHAKPANPGATQRQAQPAAPKPSQPNRVQSPQQPKPTGLLVPAVQKVRAAPPQRTDDAKKRGNVETEWKVEKGEK